MSKRALVIFGTFAVLFAILIPFLVINSKGDESAASKPVSSSDRHSQELFATNCGTCHTLKAGGTDGVVGPNLDVLLSGGAAASQDAVNGNCTRVLTAIEGGVGGRMPAGILQGQNAEDVASFVARNVNYLGVAPPKPGTEAKPITAESTNCGSGSSSTASSSAPASG
jgi:mono/diheme cytochrome c family protein